MWVDLLVLGVGAGVVPGLVTITLVLVRRGGGLGPAVGWVAGMVTVRLVQGALFGWVVPREPTIGTTGRPTVVATGMLVLALLLYATAAWKLVTGSDAPSEAPPAHWLPRLDEVGAGRAFLFGVLAIALGARQWVCTLGAIGAIGASSAGMLVAASAYLWFVLLSTALPISIVAIAWALPDRSASVLDAFARTLRAHDRVLVIGLATAFGTFFLVRAIQDFGVV